MTDQHPPERGNAMGGPGLPTTDATPAQAAAPTPTADESGAVPGGPKPEPRTPAAGAEATTPLLAVPADEPTRPLVAPADDEPTRPFVAPADDEPTHPLMPPADDEATVVTGPPSLPGEPEPVAGNGPDGPEPKAGQGVPTAGAAQETTAPDTAEPVPDEPGVPAKGADGAAEPAPDHPAGVASPWRRLSSAGALIWVLLALFGYTLVVQLRSNDQGLATARQEDLVRILSDLEARDSRLQSEISALESTQRQLTSGVAGRQAALAEANKRAEALGLLAGTLPGRGPGMRIVIGNVKASAILNAVQELRGSGGEVMQLAGADGTTVRIVASSYFVDADAGRIVVDGVTLGGPYTILVIGPTETMHPALQIPGGVVASVNSAGGSVTMEVRQMVEVTAVRHATNLRYAHPVS